MIEIVMIVALLNTTLLFCAKKWGTLDWFAIHRKHWMMQADCYFCLAFWIALFEVIPAVIITGNWWLLIIPPASCPITNYLINTAIIHDYNNRRG